jgi:hypothetical protein
MRPPLTCVHLPGYLIVFVCIQPGAKAALFRLLVGDFSLNGSAQQKFLDSKAGSASASSQHWSGGESSAFSECSRPWQSSPSGVVLTRAERRDVYRDMDEEELMGEINMSENSILIGRGSEQQNGVNPIITFADEHTASGHSIHLAFSSQGGGSASEGSAPKDLEL